MSLTADRLEVRYADHVAVQAASFELATGELIGLIGPNGAGKTSLLRALAGIPAPDARVRWHGRELTGFGADERARAIAFLPQSPQANWPLTARELIELGRLPHRRFGQRPTAADTDAVLRALRWTGIEDLADRSIDTLSGGERMRVHLARAFAVDAPVLLVDEPVESLDPYHQLKVVQLLDEYRNAGRLVVAVLHDLNLALGACTRLLLMDEGSIVADGEPRSVITDRTLNRHYRIRAWLAEHAGRAVAIPWDMLETDD
jgi:iron complex transport system ATP-binding protein